MYSNSNYFILLTTDPLVIVGRAGKGTHGDGGATGVPGSLGLHGGRVGLGLSARSPPLTLLHLGGGA
jgi:hypothetical protein